MQNPAQRCARLVAALEDLAAQEEASLRTKDFPAVESIQVRAGALVDDLVSLAASMDLPLQARIASVHARRARTSEWLEGELSAARAELRETSFAQGRVARIAPVYGGAPVGTRGQSQLSFVG